MWGDNRSFSSELYRFLVPFYAVVCKIVGLIAVLSYVRVWLSRPLIIPKGYVDPRTERLSIVPTIAGANRSLPRLPLMHGKLQLSQSNILLSCTPMFEMLPPAHQPIHLSWLSLPSLYLYVSYGSSDHILDPLVNSHSYCTS